MGTQYQLMTLFADGGLMMYPLTLCSMVALGVILAKAYTLWAAHKGTDRLLNEVEEAALAGNVDAAIEICRDTPGPAGAILLAGLRRIQTRRLAAGELEAAVSTTGTIELGFLERGLVILATIANVAPLMGFLGTVAGMILAFAAIEEAGDVDPTLVAGGIKVALLTTAAGLLIAVPVNIAYNFFVTRIDKLIVDMERGAQKILNIAWDMERSGQIQILREGSDDDEQVPVAVAASAAWEAPAEVPGGREVASQDKNLAQRALGWITNFIAEQASDEDADTD
ncbi:MAG TPA: MotA/TolQ/ExbB proton channel family protein [Gemmatimonadetes bacterium]|nr:MotA/TolQ/ExbB proton channel family protein [Gemmatimonadota bacterium]